MLAAAVSKSLMILSGLCLQRSQLNHVDDFSLLGEEELSAVTLQICALRDSASEANFTNKLRALNIPYEVRRLSSPTKATSQFVDGNCEMFVAQKSILAAELAALETPSSNLIVPISGNACCYERTKI